MSPGKAATRKAIAGVAIEPLDRYRTQVTVAPFQFSIHRIMGVLYVVGLQQTATSIHTISVARVLGRGHPKTSGFEAEKLGVGLAAPHTGNRNSRAIQGGKQWLGRRFMIHWATHGFRR